MAEEKAPTLDNAKFEAIVDTRPDGEISISLYRQSFTRADVVVNVEIDDGGRATVSGTRFGANAGPLEGSGAAEKFENACDPKRL